MEAIDVEYRIDTIMELVMESLLRGKYISPTYFTYAADKVYITEPCKLKVPAEVQAKIQKIHESISGTWLDIFVAECRVENDKILHVKSERGKSAVMVVPMTDKGVVLPARVLPYVVTKKGVLFQPEKVIDFVAKDVLE